MLLSFYIKRFLSGFLLFIFVFGITPKRILHALFATHADIKIERTNEKLTQFGKSGFNCDKDTVVAESAFEGVVHLQKDHFHEYFDCFSAENIDFSSATFIPTYLRGPPVNV